MPDVAVTAGNDDRLEFPSRRGVADYLQRIQSAAMELIRGRYVLQQDLDDIQARARSRWNYATREPVPAR